jgi:hypothetical protein
MDLVLLRAFREVPHLAEEVASGRRPVRPPHLQPYPAPGPAHATGNRPRRSPAARMWLSGAYDRARLSTRSTFCCPCPQKVERVRYEAVCPSMRSAFRCLFQRKVERMRWQAVTELVEALSRPRRHRRRKSPRAAGGAVPVRVASAEAARAPGPPPALPIPWPRPRNRKPARRSRVCLSEAFRSRRVFRASPPNLVP